MIKNVSYSKKAKKTSDISINSNCREIALHLLLRIVSNPNDTEPLPAMLSTESRRHALSDQEASFLSELTYGVLRCYSLLDKALGHFLLRPDKLSPMLRMTLRIATYELLFIRRIPSHASVAEAVTIARKRFGSRPAGLANAVLRNVSQRSSVLFDEITSSISDLGPSSSAKDISECASIPLWLSQQWIRQYGSKNASAVAATLLHAPLPCWRVNCSRQGAESLKAHYMALGCSPCGSHGFVFSFSGEMSASEQSSLLSDLAIHERNGDVSRQGSASQLISEIVARTLQKYSLSNAGLWDCCCGRGGKTAALAEQGVHVALASDPSRIRIESFKQQFARLNISSPELCCCSSQEVTGRKFSVILVDAPCSGTGTLARNPELRYRMSSEKQEAIAALQNAILEHAWCNLLPGGILFYATCALNMAENELQVRKFAGHHCGASLESMRTFLPEYPGHDTLFLAIVHKDF